MKTKLSFNELLESFKNGYPEYNPAVMWFWNDEICESEITYQLERFKENGIFEFFIHPMYGFKVVYMSDRYFQLIRYAVSEAKRLNMKFWIYDEYNWPSGSAGGFLLRNEPWTRSTVLRMVDEQAAAGAGVCLTLSGKNAVLSSDDGKVYEASEVDARLVFACTEQNGTIKDVTDKISLEIKDNSLSAAWVNTNDEPCHFMVFYTERSMVSLSSAIWSQFNWNQQGYLDVCNKEAVNKFIEYTHERYKAVIGDEFGRTVTGVFTDEVTACVPHAPDTVSNLIPWTANMEAGFKKMRGYELNSILPAIFSDSNDEKAMKARHDYWLTLSELYCSNYMKTVSEWCSGNKLKLTGHFGGEEMLVWNLTEFGDIYDASTYMNMPGLDSIFSYQYIDDHSFNIAGALVASAAHFQGKDRVLCETYTGSGWDCSLRHMKRIVNRLIILGANYIQYMGAYYSIKGFRKLLPGGYPPSHSWNNILFEYYPGLNRYISRLSWLSSCTEPCGRALVIYPMTAARHLLGGSRMWKYAGDYPLRKHELTIQGVVNSLMALNQTFEMGFEQLLEEASVEYGKLKLRGQEYDLLLLPAVTHTKTGCIKVIKDYVACGGRLVMVNDVPLNDTDAVADAEIMKIAGLKKSEVKSAICGAFGEDKIPFSCIMHEKDNVWLIVTNEFDINEKGKFEKRKFTGLIAECLDGMKPPLLQLENCDGILASHRRAGNSHFFIIANDGQDKQKIKGRVNLPLGIAALDPDSGKAFVIEVDKRDGYSEFEFELDGFESTLLIAADDIEPVSVSLPKTKFDKEILLSEGWTLDTLAPNWFVPYAGFVRQGMEQIIADHIAALPLEVCRLAENISDRNISYGSSWEIPDDELVPGKRFVAVYDFEAAILPGSIELVTEDDYPVTWYINGHIISGFKKERIWEEANYVAEINQMVHTGKNRLIAVGALPSYEAPHYLPFAGLRGEFRIEAGVMVKVNRNIKPMPWNEQGWPFYSGKAIYSCEFGLDNFIQVILSFKTNDATRVAVNGRGAGIRLWEPYTYDITGFCRLGRNKIEIEITSTYGNLFRQSIPSGLSESPVLYIKQ